MAGVKGKSGRKSHQDEGQKLKVLRAAWQVIEDTLADPNVDMALKREIAVKLVVKDMPTELSGGFQAELVAMGTIVVDGKPAEFNIGTPINSTEITESPA
jgi:hypothetical protein